MICFVIHPDVKSEFFYIEIADVHLRRGEIHVIFHFELTLEFCSYRRIDQGKIVSVEGYFGCHAGFKSLATTEKEALGCYFE